MATISIKKMTPANWIALAAIIAVSLGLAGMARAFSAEAEVGANSVTASPSVSAVPSASPSMSASPSASPAASLSPSASTDTTTGGTAGSGKTGGTAGSGKTAGTAGGSTTTTTTTTTTTAPPPPPPPPPFVPWETNDYYAGSAGEFCGAMDAARQAAGALPFSSCVSGGTMVAHAEAMARAGSVWDGDGSNISGSDTSISRVVNAFMASSSHRNQIVGDGSAAAARAGCFWWKRTYQTAADQPIVERARVFCAAQFDY